MDLIITILPVVTKDLPISPRFTPYNFLSRCKFSTLTTRQPMVEFYLLTFPPFPLRKKEHKSYFGKNRTHFRTSRCAGYLLDHSGDPVRDGLNPPAHPSSKKVLRILILVVVSAAAPSFTSLRVMSVLCQWISPCPRLCARGPVRWWVSCVAFWRFGLG